MTKRIPPSHGMRKELGEIINGARSGENLLSEIIRWGMAIIIQEMLEQEVTDLLGRAHYQRCAAENKGYCNAYEPYRIKTAEGNIAVYKPQVTNTSGPYKSTLARFLRRNSDVLQALSVEMFARGLSTRDINDALVGATGDVLLSKSADSRLTEILNEEF
jgi:transposase-like protein